MKAPPCKTCAYLDMRGEKRFSAHTVYLCQAPIPERIVLPAHMWRALLEFEVTRPKKGYEYFSPSSVRECATYQKRPSQPKEQP